MKNVLLKNVYEEDWILLKTEAAMHNMNLSEFLAYLLRDHRKRHYANSTWETALSWRSSRSEKEIAEHEERVAKNRKNFRMER
jgi:hypothetical protein